MENVGALALLLAFCISLYAIVASVAGRLRNKPFLIMSGERAMLLRISQACCAVGKRAMKPRRADGTGKVLKKELRKKYWHGQDTIRPERVGN